MSERIEGEVKWFSAEKGYGFITQDAGPDVFVHYSAIQGAGFRKLEQGDRVEFEIVDGDKGKQASNVVVLGRATFDSRETRDDDKEEDDDEDYDDDDEDYDDDDEDDDDDYDDDDDDY